MNELSPYLLQHPNHTSPEDAGRLLEANAADGEIRLRDYWRVIQKRRWSIAAFFLIVEQITALVILFTPPAYKAETTLLIDRQLPKVVDIQQDVLSAQENEAEYDYYKTQYSILQSRSLAAYVVQEQGLKDNDIFVGVERKGLPGYLSGLTQKGRHSLYSALAIDTKAEVPSETALVERYLQKTLTVEPVKKTRLVSITATTPDPDLSARLANAHANAYIRFGLALRARPTEEAEAFLRKKLGELQARVQDSEEARNRYRRRKGFTSLDDKENIVVERLNDLNKRLTEAEATRIALEAQMLLIRRQEYDSLPAVINHDLIQSLKTRLSQLEAEHARLAVEFRPTYPAAAQAAAQVEEARNRLQREIRGVVSGIGSSHLAASENEKSLRAKMEEQKNTTLELKDAAVGYAVLGRELDTNKQLYESILQKVKEMGIAAQMRTSNVVVIDRANPPLKPTSPKKPMAFAVSALIGLAGGVAFAFLREYADNRLNTPEGIQRFLHLPTLAVVPDFSTVGTNGNTLRLLPHGHKELIHAATPGGELVLDHHPLSVVTESYRMLRTAILLSRAEEPPKTILFTSGVDKEGKTLTVLNTAIMFAHLSARVLVIDADLRRSGCRRVLGTKQSFGLTELLAGQREIDEVIVPVENKLFSLLGSGSVPPNPAELLGSRRMRDILATLEERYDYILIDSPPVIPVTDAIVLSSLVDAVVLVVNSQTTSHYIAEQARARLNYARAKIIGAVLNRMDSQNWEYVYSYQPDSTEV